MKKLSLHLPSPTFASSFSDMLCSSISVIGIMIWTDHLSFSLSVFSSLWSFTNIRNQNVWGSELIPSQLGLKKNTITHFRFDTANSYQLSSFRAHWNELQLAKLIRSIFEPNFKLMKSAYTTALFRAYSTWRNCADAWNALRWVAEIDRRHWRSKINSYLWIRSHFVAFGNAEMITGKLQTPKIKVQTWWAAWRSNRIDRWDHPKSSSCPAFSPARTLVCTCEEITILQPARFELRSFYKESHVRQI